MPASRLRRYGMALMATGIALLCHYGLHPFIDEWALMLQFVLAILVSAWYGGLGPGLCATGLGAVVTQILVVPPAFRLTLPLPEDGVVLVLLVGTVGTPQAVHPGCRSQKMQVPCLAARGENTMTSTLSKTIMVALTAISVAAPLILAQQSGGSSSGKGFF